ncbi:MAG TPA: DUF4190 domain-containing protein [Microlunatus sp.]
MSNQYPTDAQGPGQLPEDGAATGSPYPQFAPGQSAPQNEQFAAGQPATPYQQAPAGQAPYGQPDQPGQPVAFDQNGAPQSGQPTAPVAGTWSKMAIAGFVVGLVVLLISLFSSYAVAAILPLGLSVAALRDIKQHGKKGKGLAIAGIVLGGISVIFYIFALIVG